MDFACSEKVEDLRTRVSDFMAAHVLPANTLWHREVEAGRYPLDLIERLKAKAYAGGAVADLPSNWLLLKNAAAMGVHWGAYRQHHSELVSVLFDELFALRRSGAIVPLIRDVFPLAEAPEALEALAGRRTVGKVVLEP